MINSNSCSILVMSCDKYFDAWLPFFKLLNIMWPNCPFRLFMCSESKEIAIDGIDIVFLHETGNWSERIKKAINYIDTKYVLFFLEDYFLISPVREKVVYSVLEWFEKDDTIGYVDFNVNPHLSTIVNEEFAETNMNYRYRINAQAGIWRKEYLKAILRDEDPWKFEVYASYRSRHMNYKVYSHISEYPMVFEYYTYNQDGYGIRRGKWLEKNPELFEKYDIKVDFTNLGFLGDEYYEHVAREKEPNWVIHSMGNALKNPAMFAHYIKCIKDIVKYRIWLFKGRFFNK